MDARQASTALAVVTTPSKQETAQIPAFHLRFHQIAFSLPPVVLSDGGQPYNSSTVARIESAPARHQGQDSNDSNDSESNVGAPPNNAEQGRHQLVVASPSRIDMAKQAYGQSSPGAEHYIDLQRRWQLEQQQKKSQQSIARQREELEQQERDRLKRKVDAGVAAVLCDLPHAGTPIHEPIVGKYSQAASPHDQRMRKLAEQRRFKNALSIVGNERSKKHLIERLTLVPQTKQSLSQVSGSPGPVMKHPQDTIAVLQQWQTELKDMLRPTPHTRPNFAKKGKIGKPQLSALPDVDLRYSTLSKQQNSSGAVGPSSRRGTPITPLKNTRMQGVHGHALDIYGGRADNDADVFSGRELPEEVRENLKQRVDKYVGSGFWNDPVGSTIAEPLTIESFTVAGKHKFRYTQRAHEASDIIKSAWRESRKRRNAAAVKIQAMLRAWHPRQAIAHWKFLRFHAVRRAQAAYKSHYAHKWRVVTLVQSVARMWMRRRRHLGAMTIQRLVRLIRNRRRAAHVILAIMRHHAFRGKLRRHRAAKAIQATWRKHRYRIPVMIQAMYRGFSRRTKFRKRIALLYRTERERRIREDLFVVENRADSLQRALAFVNSHEGETLVEALWQRCDAEMKDEKLRISQLQSEIDRQSALLSLEFDVYDLDGSGLIDGDEFKFLLKERGIFMEPHEIDEVLDHLDPTKARRVTFAAFKTWRSQFNQFGHNFNVREMFSTGAEGFASGFRSAMQLLAKQVKRDIERRRLQQESLKNDKAGRTGRRLARAKIVREFIRQDKRNLRETFRALQPNNHPPFSCPRCMGGFISELRLKYHQSRLCNGVDPSRTLPGEPRPAPLQVSGVSLSVAQEPNVRGAIASIHPEIPRPEAVVQEMKSLEKYDPVKEHKVVEAAEAAAARQALVFFKTTNWGKLQVAKMVAAHRPQRLQFEKDLFGPRPVGQPAETSAQKKRRQQAIRRYNAEIIFKEHDIDASGTLDADELHSVLDGLGMVVTPSDIAAIRSQIDTNSDGTIDFDEFCSWYTTANVVGRSQEEVSRMRLAKLKSDIVGFWKRALTSSLDLLFATYNLVRRARVKAGQRARREYRQRCPIINGVLDISVEKSEYDQPKDFGNVADVEDGEVGFDFEAVIANAVNQKPLPDFVAQLASDAKLENGDWEERERRREQKQRLKEVR